MHASLQAWLDFCCRLPLTNVGYTYVSEHHINLVSQILLCLGAPPPGESDTPVSRSTTTWGVSQQAQRGRHSRRHDFAEMLEAAAPLLLQAGSVLPLH